VSSGTSGSAGMGAGTSGSSGSGGGDDPPEDEGCGCRVVGKSQGSLAAIFAALALAGAVFTRRRARSPKSRS